MQHLLDNRSQRQQCFNKQRLLLKYEESKSFMRIYENYMTATAYMESTILVPTLLKDVEVSGEQMMPIEFNSTTKFITYYEILRFLCECKERISSANLTGDCSDPLVSINLNNYNEHDEYTNAGQSTKTASCQCDSGHSSLSSNYSEDYTDSNYGAENCAPQAAKNAAFCLKNLSAMLVCLTKTAICITERYLNILGPEFIDN